MSDHPDCIHMVARERTKEFLLMAERYRMAKLCRQANDRGLFRNVVCMMAQRMIALGTYLLSRYGESPEAVTDTRPAMRRRRAM